MQKKKKKWGSFRFVKIGRRYNPANTKRSDSHNVPHQMFWVTFLKRPNDHMKQHFLRVIFVTFPCWLMINITFMSVE